MDEATAKWAAQRAKAALDELERHDAENRRLIDAGAESPHVDWAKRITTRTDLSARVAEASRVLVRVVLG